ncbi:hypothetical protein LINPERHAP1_LOCUS42089 [Linum perenne]
MDHGDPPPTRRKPLKFAPKSASQRKPKLATPKAEEVSDGSKEEEAEKAQQIMNRFNENLKRQVTRAEKKSAQAQVVFGAPASSPSIRKFGVPKSETSDHHGNKSSSSSRKKKSYVIASDDDDDEPGDAMQIDGSSRGGIDGSRQRIAKQYKEPFDYESSYYPTTLPLRKPYSGDPGIEFFDEKMCLMRKSLGRLRWIRSMTRTRSILLQSLVSRFVTISTPTVR